LNHGIQSPQKRILLIFSWDLKIILVGESTYSFENKTLKRIIHYGRSKKLASIGLILKNMNFKITFILFKESEEFF